MLENIIDSLEYTIKSSQNLLNKEKIIEENNISLQKQVQEHTEYLKFIKGAKEKYQIAVNELYEESVAALQNTLNTALKYVLYKRKFLTWKPNAFPKTITDSFAGTAAKRCFRSAKARATTVRFVSRRSTWISIRATVPTSAADF